MANRLRYQCRVKPRQFVFCLLLVLLKPNTIMTMIGRLNQAMTAQPQNGSSPRPLSRLRRLGAAFAGVDGVGAGCRGVVMVAMSVARHFEDVLGAEQSG